MSRPDILVPDTTPLIHLARAGELRLLHEIGGTVFLVDVVAQEAVRDANGVGAADLAAWIAAGRMPGSNTPIRVEETGFGRALSLARQVEPRFSAGNGVEVASVQWLATTVQAADRATIVLYENGRVPGIVANQGTDAEIDVLTARAFLDLAERRGLVPSAKAVWEKVVDAAPVTPVLGRRAGM